MAYAEAEVEQKCLRDLLNLLQLKNVIMVRDFDMNLEQELQVLKD